MDFCNRFECHFNWAFRNLSVAISRIDSMRSFSIFDFIRAVLCFPMNSSFSLHHVAYIWWLIFGFLDYCSWYYSNKYLGTDYTRISTGTMLRCSSQPPPLGGLVYWKVWQICALQATRIGEWIMDSSPMHFIWIREVTCWCFCFLIEWCSHMYF